MEWKDQAPEVFTSQDDYPSDTLNPMDTQQTTQHNSVTMGGIEQSSLVLPHIGSTMMSNLSENGPIPEEDCEATLQKDNEYLNNFVSEFANQELVEVKVV